MMNDTGKSDGAVVPVKSPNKTAQAVAEVVEGRALTKGNMPWQNVPQTQSWTKGMPSALQRVREVAKKNKKQQFTALMHHVTLEALHESYKAIRQDAATGVDGVTWQQYGRALGSNLQDLHAKLHCGAYRAKPSRRVFIPKASGGRRPLGIAALEDKIVQGAVAPILNAIYEEDFLGFSYGFRPGRSQHQALDALAVGIRRKKVNWVLDADIRGFFDTIDHKWLFKFVEHRIADKRILRLIRKWLTAGYVEEGKQVASTVGSPQGATISPLLANVYLHYVMDLWVGQWRKRRAQGEVLVVRYADDVVFGFQLESDARRFWNDLRQRLAKFHLELHPDKTKLIRFGRFASLDRQRRQLGKPETFTFLGFDHICGQNRIGRFLVMRLTNSKRMRARLAAIKVALRRRLHWPVPKVGKWLSSVVRGYFEYHAVPMNFDKVAQFRSQVIRTWCKTLRRRSQRHRFDWARMTRLANSWLPKARILHPWPETRFDAITRGRSPVR